MVSICRRIFPLGFKKEFVEMLKIAWPAILTSFLQFFLQTVSIIMCGHLSKAELDAAGLANSMINVFGLSIGMGMSTACDTFFSQTFGSGNKKKVGAYLQKSLVIVNLVAMLICCVHINIEPILIGMGQNPEIVKLTAKYMLCFLPGLFSEYNYLVLARYLQNQNILYPSLVCAIVGNVVNVVSQYIAIYIFEFSYLASAVCQASSFFVMMLLEILYILISKVYESTWNGWTFKDAICDWGLFARLAIPGVFLVGLEEWSFEVATFVAGTINTIELGIQAILFQLETICYMIPLGISIAVNIRVGQHLGANRPEHAKSAYRVGLAIVFMTATTMALIFLALRNYIPLIFTKDKEIVIGVSSVLILNAGFQYGDGIAAVSAGALRGCGRQLTGAIVLFFGYYIIGLPIGVALALKTSLKVFGRPHHLSCSTIPGLWVGLLIGISLEALVFVFVVQRTDWDHQCEQAARIAYGTINSHNVVKTEFEDLIGHISDGECSYPSSNEEEPLLGDSRRRRHRSSVTISYSSRATVDPADVEILEMASLSGREFRSVVYNRVIFVIVALFIVASCVVVRIMQQDYCVVVNNVTLSEYAGVLPICNTTSP